MSAEEAWREWHAEWSKAHKFSATGYLREGFMAGYRRALDDAADAVEHLPIQKTAAALRLNAAAELRARAAAADPRETED